MKTDGVWLVLVETIDACDDERDRVLLTESLTGLQSVEIDYAPLPDFTDAELDAARSAGSRLTSGQAEPAAAQRHLAALPHDQAGRLVTQLLTQGRNETLAWVTISVPPHRFPVADLLLAANAAVDDVRRDLLRAAALVPTVGLIRGIVDTLTHRSTPAGQIGAMISEVTAIRRAIAETGDPYRWWEQPRAALPQPAHRWQAGAWPWPWPSPKTQTQTQTQTIVPSQRPASRFEPDPASAHEPRLQGPRVVDGDVLRGPEQQRRTAYPQLHVETGTERADVVVVDQPFQVSVGLQSRRDSGLISSSPMSFAGGEVVQLQLMLLFDPGSIEVTGSPRGTITVSDADPFPTLSFSCVARWVDRVGRRRIGVQLLREGHVVAVAWRMITAVDTPAEVGRAEAPPNRALELLDLDPLLGDEPPDLIVTVCRADVASPTFVWASYAADPAVAVADLPSTTTLEDDVAAFALEARRSIQFSADPAMDYLGLAGRAVRIGRAVPEAIESAIRQVVEAPGRTSAPAILLLTEELHVPWELASFARPLVDPWGGSSPFLGAHVALARWPLTEHRPRPHPRPKVSVRSAAVLTADYQGVPGWGRLESAVAEATEVATLFDPEAPQIVPDLWTVMNLFRGNPAADLVHVALHGQYDAQGDQEGLVLLTKSPAGGAVAQFLSPTVLESGELAQGPFVFLNACQVGTDERVLGDYGGFASTLLRIGAAGVVAPLWNIRDDIAAEVARRFYAATLTAASPVSAAEAIRAVRATYTEEAVRAGLPGLHATLLAYQVFGHPRLTLTH